jgi:hypothetical protein
MARERIVAIALLTETNLAMLKGSLPKVFRIREDDRFKDLLTALDELGTISEK